MQFAEGAKLYDFVVEREGGEDILYINYLKALFAPSLADSAEIMERTIDLLIENPNVSRIVFVQQKNYNYDFRETTYLLEIASLYVHLIRQEKILSQERLASANQNAFSFRYNAVFSFLYLLKKDPILAHSELKRLIYESKVFLERISAENYRVDQKNYISLLLRILGFVEGLKIIQDASVHMDMYVKGSREIYHHLFKPDVIPNFTFTRLVSDLPMDAEIIDEYKIALNDYDISNVTILKKRDESKLVYHIVPPEHALPEEQNELLNLARGVLIEHQPKAEEFTDSDRTRHVFFNVSKDLLRDLAENRNIELTFYDLNKLATILVRHTIGFGLIEVLLQDKNLQDISLNAPIAQVPVYVRHNDYDECTTNIFPSFEDADSWAAKFRMLSGRPLDEANPILDTQLEFSGLRARVAIIQDPLSPDGLAFSIRRHRESPWTLPLFIENKMINPFAAGLMSFLIDGARTLLIAGTRSSGKTSFLGSLMLEIIPKYRVITVEDSLELPIESLRELGYNILRMKVRSALLKNSSEVDAADGIRTSLRLGDSCLIMGEVRSVEALALYEAMRVGALANVVAGTIHGASPYGVYDRVVNDLGVPTTSFKATDIIAVANPIKSADGLHSWRRMLQITEVRKHWEKDPLLEKGFIDLMKYDVEKDELEPSEDLINGDSEIVKDIASKVKGWAGNWDAVYDNILLRAKMKEELVNLSKKSNNKNILEAGFNIRANHEFHKISDDVISEIGLPLGSKVFPKWQKWLNEEVKSKKI